MGSRIQVGAALATLLKRQHGLVSRDQALAMGMTHHQVRYKVTSGQWVVADHGVYRHEVVPATWHARVLGACLSTGAVASHRTAAVLWGLDGFHMGIPEVTLPAHSSVARPGIRIHSTTTFARCEITKRSATPTTGTGRTLVDLAKVVPYEKLRQAVDDARLKDLVDWDRIARCFMSHARRGRDGTTNMRSYLDEHLGEAEIPLSTWSRLVSDQLVNYGLPKPEIEYEVAGPGYCYKIDLAYPELYLGIELDSIAWHLNRRSFQEDRNRTNHLENLGWSMRSFTWQDYSRRAASLVNTVRTARQIRMDEIARSGRAVETWG